MPRGVKADSRGRQGDHSNVTADDRSMITGRGGRAGGRTGSRRSQGEEPRTSAQFAQPIAQSDDAMVAVVGETGGESEATGGGRTVRRRAGGTASRSRGARKASGAGKAPARKSAGSRKRTGTRKAASSSARKAASSRKAPGSRTSSRGSRKSARVGSRKSSR